MTFKQLLTTELLHVVAWANPDYAPLIDFVTAHDAEIEGAGPIILAEVNQGHPAFEAAEKASPELGKAIKTFVHTVPATAGSHAESHVALARHAENVTRKLVGLHPMTPAEEKVWMDRASPIDDSRQGSG